MKRLISIALFVGVLFAAVDGALLGARVADATTQPGHQQLVIEAPALAAASRPDALRSPGGFTGFGGAPALTGNVLRSGAIASVDAAGGRFMINAPGSEVAIQYTTAVRLFRLRPLSGALHAGDVVVIHYRGDTPVGVLRVPTDLEQGVGTSETPRQRGITLP
jgi:hypothetical protein